MILNLDSLNIEGYEMGESNSQKNDIPQHFIQ